MSQTPRNQYADTNTPGILSAGAQSISGVKTLNNAPVISDASGIVAASASVPGILTTGSQTIAGSKSFNNAIGLIGGLLSGSIVSTLGTLWWSGAGTLDVGALLINGQSLLLFVYQRAASPTTQSYITYCARDDLGFTYRDILATNSPGNNNGSMSWNGTTITATGGGVGTSGRIVYIRIT